MVVNLLRDGSMKIKGDNYPLATGTSEQRGHAVANGVFVEDPEPLSMQAATAVRESSTVVEPSRGK